MASIHETMSALHNIGAIDRETMRESDEACLTPVRRVRWELPEGDNPIEEQSGED